MVGSNDIEAVMALSDSSYSRLVSWLKLLLPLFALGILSTLFFLARTVDPEMSIAIAEEDVASLANEPRLSDPSFRGVSPDGTAVYLSADLARPDPEDAENLIASAVSARLEPEDGSWLTVRSESGVLDTHDGAAHLSEQVVVETSTGLTVRTDKLDASLRLGEVSTDTRITATTPFGALTANAMRYASGGAASGGNLLVFSQGVNLIYHPVN